MRILMLNHNVAFGGNTFQRVYYLARHLARFGHQPSVMTISKREKFRFRIEQREGVEMVYTPDIFWGIGRTGWDPWDTFRRLDYIWRRTYDVVYAFDSRPVVLIPALMSAKRLGIPLMMDWADWWGRGGTIQERSFKFISSVVGPMESWLEEAFRTKANRTTVISRALAQRAEGLGIDPKTILRIPNGCDTEGIRPADKRESRRRLNLPLDTPLVGHLGHLYPRDAQLLADTIAILLRECPELRLVMIGNPGLSFQRYWPTKHGLITPGFVPESDLAAWLTACDTLLLPLTDSVHNRGRWPGKVNDYFSAGRPVVSTDVGDVKELLGQYTVGMLAQATPQALASITLELLNQPSRQVVLAKEARRLAETDLSWSRIAARVHHHLNALA